ncbi:Blue-light-activated histidine kinase [Seminavis robusta]|uniref:Blue-light-activated histidine kinase n=1 Tax=Seminavis robusta TaxID=568900 RepID=A0A9N8EM37_9STRA|nr:Blue-light-activated histidine kinase [Seminavis robusta]|eukprot:Sro1194_g251270.1 Blue-light-activated histidine kinase (411) ;mRNA; f:9962-11866
MATNFAYMGHPLFAPASQQQQVQVQAQQPAPAAAPQQQAGGDDFDLNEIFADYFTNEFEDPLNAYTGGMATYGQSVGGTSLPTGGIKTQFHLGTTAAQAHAAALAQQQANAAPPAKKAKHDPTMAMVAQQGGGGGGGITLPVGVGIQVGGLGGVAPQTAAGMANGAGGGNMWDQNYAGMSEQAIAERRLRNREHAKRSRVRKKFMLESLQGEVLTLQKENENLRLLIQTHLPSESQEIISECCTTNPLFADGAEGEVVEPKKSTQLEKSDFTLMESLSGSQQNFVLSDPRLPDNPIVFASPGFYKLTGYTSKEVLGRNCRFLQGPGTDARAVEVIRKAIQTGADTTVCILNYKADGTPFWNQFFLASLRDSENNIVNFVGVQCEVEPEVGQSALEDKVNAVLPLEEKEKK